MLAHIQKMNGYTVGLATTDGVYVDGERTVAGDMTGPQSAQMILRDPSVDFAVLETARGGLLRSGLGYRSCDVGAVLNVQSDHLGQRGVETLEQLAEVKRIVVEVAKECAVLNADDINCLHMADHTQAARIGYVTMNPRHELVRQHIRAGGLACVLEDGINGQMITLFDKGAHLPLLWTHLIPATLEGKALHNVQNAMFAATMAYAMGVRIDNIKHGLRTFDSTFFQAPGRMNVWDKLPFKVILDYGHNPAAISAMISLVRKLEITGKRICVLSAPGDRRDEDIQDVARAAAAGNLDHYFVRRDDDPRGRGPGEIPKLLREVLLQAGIPDERITVIPDEVQAIEAALRMGQRGDLVLIFGDKPSRCWKQIIYFKPEGADPIPAAPSARARDSSAAAASDEAPLLQLQSLEIISDERGVRLAQKTED